MFEGDVGKMKLNEPESQRIIRNAKKYHIKERLYDTHTSQKGDEEEDEEEGGWGRKK